MSLANDLNKIDTDLKQVKTDTNTALSEKGSAGVITLSELPLAIRNIPSGGGSGISSADYEHIVTDYLIQDSNVSEIIFTAKSYPKIENCKEVFVFIEKPSEGKYTSVATQFRKDNARVSAGEYAEFSSKNLVFVMWHNARESFWKTAYLQGAELNKTWNLKFQDIGINPTTWGYADPALRDNPHAYKDWNNLRLVITANSLPVDTKINIWGRQ